MTPILTLAATLRRAAALHPHRATRETLSDAASQCESGHLDLPAIATVTAAAVTASTDVLAMVYAAELAAIGAHKDALAAHDRALSARDAAAQVVGVAGPLGQEQPQSWGAVNAARLAHLSFASTEEAVTAAHTAVLRAECAVMRARDAVAAVRAENGPAVDAATAANALSHYLASCPVPSVALIRRCVVLLDPPLDA